eukprot:5151068-Amphidinium_carterae.1
MCVEPRVPALPGDWPPSVAHKPMLANARRCRWFQSSVYTPPGAASATTAPLSSAASAAAGTSCN